MSDMYNALAISAMGMRAQGSRIEVISENIANANTAATMPDEDPYTRQIITFKNEMNRQEGIRTVQVEEINQDTKTPYPLKYMPDHPGADENGFVKMPNVNTLVEMMDMREAQRSYEANLGMMTQSRSMAERTIAMIEA